MKFDEYPSKIYNANHKVQIDLRDIHEVKPNEIPDVDVIIGGFLVLLFLLQDIEKVLKMKEVEIYFLN